MYYVILFYILIYIFHFHIVNGDREECWDVESKSRPNIEVNEILSQLNNEESSDRPTIDDDFLTITTTTSDSSNQNQNNTKRNNQLDENNEQKLIPDIEILNTGTI
ncbi:hypothetical protein RclHR1_31340002 [Rhizophagus clarus]|uniref:Uncharacterized protein n=1 Tax=Rhizophagus clarus TaxID=94130 RepID=A0A2Z6R7D1_9GLOM|nr:hypothetical protein RclHR1_31340002 [Rhizophagus clarus]